MKYQNPGAASTVIFERDNKILFIIRKHEPYKGRLALPGGFNEYGKETLERTAQREAEEEVHLKVRQKDLYLLCVNSSPRRDPRGPIIDHIYIALDFIGEPRADDDAAEYVWMGINEMPKRLAFDHAKNIPKYLEWRKKND